MNYDEHNQEYDVWANQALQAETKDSFGDSDPLSRSGNFELGQAYLQKLIVKALNFRTIENFKYSGKPKHDLAMLEQLRTEKPFKI